MKDTIIKSDGTSHFIKAPQTMPESYTEWREMVLSGTATLDIALNPDGCTEVGTPLNKSTLLSDETKAELEIDQGDPSVDDALSKLSHKANGSHVHNLDSDEIDGILPPEKGGTGRTDLISAITAMFYAIPYSEIVDFEPGVSSTTVRAGEENKVKIRKIGNLVFLEGYVKINDVTGNTQTLFNVPFGYAPTKTHVFFAPCSGTNVARINVYATNRAVNLNWIYGLSGGKVTGAMKWVAIDTMWVIGGQPEPGP